MLLAVMGFVYKKYICLPYLSINDWRMVTDFDGAMFYYVCTKASHGQFADR